MFRFSSVMIWVIAGLAPQGDEQDRKTPPPVREPQYAVVIHADNKTTETGDAAKATIKRLYLKDLSQWPDGTAARPYGRESSSPEHAAFVKHVLNMSDAELARHWLRVKNMNGTTPPKEVDSERMVLKHVARVPGAFSIVKISAVTGAKDVKVLFEF